MSMLNLLFHSLATFDNTCHVLRFFAVLCKRLFKTIYQYLIEVTPMARFGVVLFCFSPSNLLVKTFYISFFGGNL